MTINIMIIDYEYYLDLDYYYDHSLVDNPNLDSKYNYYYD